MREKLEVSEDFDFEYFAEQVKKLGMKIDTLVSTVMNDALGTECEKHSGGTCRCIERAVAFSAAYSVGAGISNVARKKVGFVGPDIEKFLESFTKMMIDSDGGVSIMKVTRETEDSSSEKEKNYNIH